MNTLRWLQAAHPHLAAANGRVVVVQPTVGISGAPEFAALAGLAEAQRALVETAARQWRGQRMAINVVAVRPDLFAPQLALPELDDTWSRVAQMGAGQGFSDPPLPLDVGGDLEPLVAFLCSPVDRRHDRSDADPRRRDVDGALMADQPCRRGPLSGRTAIVTGAGGGIGRGIALALGRAGASVVVAARRTETGEPVAEEIRRRGGSAVVRTHRRHDCRRHPRGGRRNGRGVRRPRRPGAQRARTRGPQSSTRIENLDLDELREIAATTTTATLHSAQAGFPYLRNRRGRYIVVSSTAGVRGNPVLPVYSILKAAQRGIVRSLACEWAPHAITVNTVNPVARTEAVDALIDANRSRRNAWLACAPRVPRRSGAGRRRDGGARRRRRRSLPHRTHVHDRRRRVLPVTATTTPR